MTFPQSPFPDPYANPPQWLPPGDLLQSARPDTSSGMGNWMGGSGHWWGSGGGNAPASDPVARVNGSTMGLLPGAPYVTSRQAPGINELIIYQLKGNLVRFELIIRDLSGGYDLQMAEIGPGSVPNLIAEGTLDVSLSRTVMLPPKVDTDSTAANLAATWKGALHSVKLVNEFFAPIIGAGSTADKSLFKFDQGFASGSTWEEDFTITPQTYSPPSHIVSLSQIYINSVKRPRICIGFGDDPARVISEIDGTPTADGTMHANTEPCFGAFDTGLNSTTPGATNTLLYANNGWWVLSSTAAISDAPTQTLSGINNGGFIVGGVELSGASLRLYYVEPIQDLGKTHMMDTNAATSGAPTSLGRVRSVNYEAEDLQDLDVGLDYVIDCKKWRGGLVQTDGLEVTWHNGQIVNLSFNREGKWASDAVVSISGLAVIGDRLFAMVVERTASTSYLYFYEYILEENAWYPAFEKITLTDGRFPVFVRETPFLKYIDRATGAGVHRFFYGVGLTSGDGITQWRSVPLWPRTYNPFYSQTTGNMPRNFATTGTLTTPVYHFLEGMPKIVSDIQYMGEFRGTAASLQIQIGTVTATGITFDTSSQSATFNSRDRWDKHIAPFYTPALLDRLQIKLTGNQGSDSTRKTSNFVPFKVCGYAFRSMADVKMPAEIADWVSRGWG